MNRIKLKNHILEHHVNGKISGMYIFGAPPPPFFFPFFSTIIDKNKAINSIQITIMTCTNPSPPPSSQVSSIILTICLALSRIPTNPPFSLSPSRTSHKPWNRPNMVYPKKQEEKKRKDLLCNSSQLILRNMAQNNHPPLPPPKKKRASKNEKTNPRPTDSGEKRTRNIKNSKKKKSYLLIPGHSMVIPLQFRQLFSLPIHTSPDE
ncbi:hypothetical protein V8C37DRAFT_289625 [Trichoderma ceciliae]